MSQHHERVTTLIQLMMEAPRTYDELAFLSQMSKASVLEWVKTWRSVMLVRIAEWERDARGHPTIMRFSWEPGKSDEVCPTMTASERVANWRKRQKGSAK